MKKLLFMLLCLCMILAVTACGENVDNADEGEVSTVRDMSGLSFIFGTIRPTELFQEEAYSQSGDRMLERYREIEAQFGCSFTVATLVDAASGPIRSAQATGVEVPDIVDIGGDVAYSLYKVDSLVPYNDIPGINLDDEDKWGSKNFIISGNFGGQQYGVFPNKWEFIPQMGGGLLFNNPLNKEWGLPNPYELYESKQWTWDTFKKILIDGRHDEEKTKYYSFMVDDGWSSNGPILMKTVIYSNGGQTLVNRAGKLTFGYDSAESIEAMEWAGSLLADDLMKKTNTAEMEDFTQGKCVYFLGDTWRGTIHIENAKYLPSEQMDEYGFMHFPSGPKVEAGYTSTYVSVDKRLMFLPALTDNEPEDLGLILNYLFEVLDRETKITWKEVLATEIMHHKEDTAVFMKMYNNVLYDQSAYYVDIVSSINTAFTEVYNKKGGAAEAMQKISDKVNAEVNKNLYGEE